jgi:piezo-type mechanosensitive ion channel component 1/2
VASDKYTQAIFGYSVMSFYISIILVIANYFRFLFQGSVHNIIYSDIPHPDPLLVLCNAIFIARLSRELQREEQLFWTVIDLLRSPDTLKALTGDYLDARLRTLKDKEQ